MELAARPLLKPVGRCSRTRRTHARAPTRSTVCAALEADDLPLRYDPVVSEQYFRTRPVQVVSRAVEVFGLAGNLAAALFVDDKLGRTETNRKLRARQTRNLLAALGPTFIKAGQALSIRVDLLPKEYIAELRQLQDNVPAFDTAVARRALERELKMPSWRGGVDALFDDFPAEPIAAASLGQVYKTRVKATGQQVAVKVQRPDMLPGILLDLYLLRQCVPYLMKQKKLNTDLVAVVDEWGVRFVDELDYRREAANATQFGEAMAARGLTSLCTAAVVPGLTSQRVLTTEWVDGTRLDESAAGDEARLCGIALNGYLTMLLDTGVLHADPHPGNLLRTTDGRLCILDFGLVTELTQEQQYSIIEYIAHLISENFIKVPGDLSRLGFIPSGKEAAMDDAGVVRVLAAAFQRLAQGGGAKSLRRSAGVKAKAEGGGVDELGGELKRISEKWGNLFQIPPYFAYILRAFSVLEGIGLQSNPDYAIAQECYPYLARRLFTDDSPRGKAALREMLYGSGEQKALNVTRLTKLSTAAQSFRDTVIEAPPRPAATDAKPSGSGRAASEVADILLAAEGNYLQELLVKEAARMADVFARDRVKRAGETPVGQLALSAAAAQQQLAASLGPLRPFAMPLPTPNELAEWMAPALTSDDQAVLQSSEVLWTLLQPALSRATGSGHATASGASSGFSQEFLEQLPGYAQQYGPGLQRVASSFVEESLRRTAVRLNEATRPEVSFPSLLLTDQNEER